MVLVGDHRRLLKNIEKLGRDDRFDGGEERKIIVKGERSHMKNAIIGGSGRRETFTTSSKIMLALALLIPSTLIITSSLMAQKAVTPLKAYETITPLMSNDLAEFPGKEVLMYTVDFPPGFSSPVHRHNAQVSLYVLEGSVVMQVKGGKEVTLTAGQSFYESPDDIHVVSRNASSSKPAKFLVFLIKNKNAPLVTPVK